MATKRFMFEFLRIMLNLINRFRHHGNQKLSRIRIQSTSRMSLPMSQFTSHRQRHPVHHNSSFHRSRKATKCRTLSHFHIMAAVRASAATSVTCRLPISSLRHHCHELSTWPLVGCVWSSCSNVQCCQNAQHYLHWTQLYSCDVMCSEWSAFHIKFTAYLSII